MFENYKDCLFNDKIMLKQQQVFRSDHHNIYTVEINNIAFSSNDDKRLQTFVKISRIHMDQMPLKCVKVKWLQGETFLLKTMQTVCFMMK